MGRKRKLRVLRREKEDYDDWLEMDKIEGEE